MLMMIFIPIFLFIVVILLIKWLYRGFRDVKKNDFSFFVDSEKLYKEVTLLTNKYEKEGALYGVKGYIIEQYADHRYEVEFSNPQTGESIAQVVVSENEIDCNEEYPL